MTGESERDPKKRMLKNLRKKLQEAVDERVR
jgi:hypothetical protein